MARDFALYDSGGAAWRSPSVSLSAYYSASWRTLKDAWIYDATPAQWRLGYTTASVSSLSGTDVGADPTNGLLDVVWSHSGDCSIYTVSIDADLSDGTTYAAGMWAGGDPTLDAKSLDFSGTPGFTTLDTVNIRLRLLWGSVVVTELTAGNPWPI